MPRPTALAALLLLAVLAAPVHAELGDPTRPAFLPTTAGAPGDSPASLLSSIWVAGDHRVAVVDGQRVEIGDTAAGGTVVAIELSGVRVRRSGGDLLLTLTGGGFKEPATRRKTQ